MFYKEMYFHGRFSSYTRPLSSYYYYVCLPDGDSSVGVLCFLSPQWLGILESTCKS